MIYIVQGKYGDGWEDLIEYDTRHEAQSELDAYNWAEPQYPHRIQPYHLRDISDEQVS